MQDADSRMTEPEAVSWLAARGVRVSLRTLKAMRARGDLAYWRLPAGRNRVLYSPAQLMEAFRGEETRNRPAPPRVRRAPRARPQSAVDRELARLLD